MKEVQMKLRCTALILAILTIVPHAAAQNAVGTWLGETSGAAGLARRPLKLVLKTDGTGTIEIEAVRPLLDLKVDGNKVSFAFRPLVGGQPAGFLFRYNGEVKGDQMTLYVSMEREGVEPTRSQDPLILKRDSGAR
jgi:hypothetical protein